MSARAIPKDDVALAATDVDAPRIAAAADVFGLPKKDRMDGWRLPDIPDVVDVAGGTFIWEDEALMLNNLAGQLFVFVVALSGGIVLLLE